MTDIVPASEIFDRAARRQRRDRAAAGDPAAHAFLRDTMVDGLLERLSAVKRSFADALDIGASDRSLSVPGARMARMDDLEGGGGKTLRDGGQNLREEGQEIEGGGARD